MKNSIVIDLETVKNNKLKDLWLAKQGEDAQDRFPPPWTWEIACMGHMKLEGLRPARASPGSCFQ